ncbi:hypothetical protein BCR34DRAFT_181469 [Clohesyomyces aquaticus]|uniref:Uncharacterized protein n=1 Tax=Clohesyomyces aquaticus TaxID=1231657 RepID=A0A1Y1YEA9_9PLEO|nr:hypothetical protein BCR34DRAFT_181469 [Clohesyomyces aquaticus]
MPQLAPAISKLARQTLQRAFEDLEHTITPSESRLFRTTTLQHVRTAALEIEEQLAARQALRNMRRLTPLFNGLEHYSSMINTLCNGTPYLPWIWAPITIILRIASEYVEAFEKIIKAYSRIAESLGRFVILDKAFSTKQDFQQTLAVFYADILEFHKHAYKFVRRNGWKLLFRTSFGRFERRFEGILDDLNRHGDLIDREANAHNIAEARAWREDWLVRVQRAEEEQAAQQYESVMAWLKTDDSEQLSIFESTWGEGSKYPGTCEWVVQNSKLKSWLQRKPDNPVLWLQGKAGSGKSVIATHLVKFLQIDHHSPVVRHICNYSYASSTKYEQILRSLLLQLLRRNGELLAHVYQEYVLGKRSPALVTLEQLFQSLTGSISDEPRQTEYLWIVLDGLDECEIGKQARLINLVNQLASNASKSEATVCKILVSSRRMPMIFKRLRKKQIVSLGDESEHLEEAIRRYAALRLRSLRSKFRQVDLAPSEFEETEKVIAKKSDGMFLYARLVLDYLTANIFYSGEEIKSSIYELPPTLADFYHKILTQILVRLDARSVDRIKCMLGWIAFAKRPLKKLELLSAVSFSAGDSDVVRLAPEFMLELCSPLIEERGDAMMQFIHASVKEFLQTPASTIMLSDKILVEAHGVATLTCLISGLEVFSERYEQQKRCVRLVKGLHGFHIYSTEYWIDYLLDSTSESAEGLVESSTLVKLACGLALRLAQMDPSASLGKAIPESTVDGRLKRLQRYPSLCRVVEAAAEARSLKRLEAELLQESDTKLDLQSLSRPAASDGISMMLENYQRAVESLLSQDSYPGVSAEELELFKGQFRHSAFTCRLRSCSRATLGFDSEKLRHEHELAHTRGFRCEIAGCPYPAFGSASSLKAHMNKHHSAAPARRQIRRVGPLSISPTPLLQNSSELPRSTPQTHAMPQETFRQAQTELHPQHSGVRPPPEWVPPYLSELDIVLQVREFEFCLPSDGPPAGTTEAEEKILELCNRVLFSSGQRKTDSDFPFGQASLRY